MMKSMFYAAAIACIAASGATAATMSPLTIDISGASGGNTTTWTFSGSAVSDSAGAFTSGDNLFNSNLWLNLGDFTTLEDLEITSVSGDATLTIGTNTRGIDLVYVDTDANGDDVGIGVTGTTNFGFTVGDVISFTGSLIATGLGIGDLGVSGLPFSATTNFFGAADPTLSGPDLTLTINEIAPVPLPAGLPLLVAGLGGLAVLRKRKAA